jgi:hypothetical protein
VRRLAFFSILRLWDIWDIGIMLQGSGAGYCASLVFRSLLDTYRLILRKSIMKFVMLRASAQTAVHDGQYIYTAAAL